MTPFIGIGFEMLCYKWWLWPVWVVKDLYLLNMVYGWSVCVNINRTDVLSIVCLVLSNWCYFDVWVRSLSMEFDIQGLC